MERKNVTPSRGDRYPALSVAQYVHIMSISDPQILGTWYSYVVLTIAGELRPAVSDKNWAEKKCNPYNSTARRST